MKPYYSDDWVTLFNADCAIGLSAIPDASVQLVVTSPPYDALRDYKGYSFNFPAIAAELVRVLDLGGAIVWVVGDQTENGSESGTSFRQALRFMELGLKLHDTMIFEKHNFSNPSHTRYHQIFEYMFVFTKGKIKTFNPIKDKQNAYGTAWGRNTFRDVDGVLKERKRNEYKEIGMRNNIWRYLVGNITGDDSFALEHPATFPEQLASDHINSWSNPGDTVLDCFSGSGTTLKAAKLHGRKGVGFEISEEYCRLSVKRLQQEYLPLSTPPQPIPVDQELL